MAPSRATADGLLWLAAFPGCPVPFVAAQAGPIDIPGETPACAPAEDRIDCLSKLADLAGAQ